MSGRDFVKRLLIQSERPWWLTALIFVPLAYALILILFAVSRPVAARVQEPVEGVRHLLNQGIVDQADYRYLLAMSRQGLVPDRNVLREYKDYFERVVNALPGQADAYAMLGYCYYYLGQEEMAVKAYLAAVQVNSDVFGFYYNLAVIYYNKGEIQQAFALTQKALSLSMTPNAQFIVSSKRVGVLIASQLPGSFPANLEEYLTASQGKAMDLARLCAQRLSGSNGPATPVKVLLQLM